MRDYVQVEFDDEAEHAVHVIDDVLEQLCSLRLIGLRLLLLAHIHRIVYEFLRVTFDIFPFLLRDLQVWNDDLKVELEPVRHKEGIKCLQVSGH